MSEKVMRLAMLAAFIADNVKGTSALSIETETVPEMRKTGNPFVGKVVKRQTLNGMVGFDYERAVNRLAAKEGAEEREAKPRAWGTLTADRIFVCKNNDGVPTHLRMKVEKSIDPRYFHIDGNEIAKDLLKQFLTVKSKSSTQADLQGEVVERDVTLANIKVLHFRGDTYRISDEPLPVIVPESEKPAKVDASETEAQPAAPVAPVPAEPMAGYDHHQWQ